MVREGPKKRSVQSVHEQNADIGVFLENLLIQKQNYSDEQI